MGNYESLQLEIGVEDSPRGDEKFAEAFNRVKDFVESRLLSDVDKLEQDIIDVRKAVKDRNRERLVEQAAAEDK
jgi:hypothetical protein